MATVTYTPLLGLALPTTGDLGGIWGIEVNNAITSLTDSAVAGTVVLSTDVDVTLTVTNGVSNQARNAIIVWSAGGSVERTITAPAKSKVYVVINASSGTQTIRIIGTGGAPSSGVTVIKGEKCVVAWSSAAADFVKVSSSIASGLDGVLQPDHGGTGQSAYTAGDTLYASGTTAISKLPIGLSSYIMTSSGAAPQWTNPASVSVGNLFGGAQFRVPYQTAANTTAFTVAPTIANTVLNWNGATFDWVSAPASTSATNIANGLANQIVYQTAPSTTSFITAPTTPNTSLVWNGASYSWSAAPLGTVTSVSGSGGTTGLTLTGGPITGIGTLTLGGTLAVNNGGTGIPSSEFTVGTNFYFPMYKAGIGRMQLVPLTAGAGITITTSLTGPTISAQVGLPQLYFYGQF